MGDGSIRVKVLVHPSIAPPPPRVRLKPSGDCSGCTVCDLIIASKICCCYAGESWSDWADQDCSQRVGRLQHTVQWPRLRLHCHQTDSREGLWELNAGGVSAVSAPKALHGFTCMDFAMSVLPVACMLRCKTVQCCQNICQHVVDRLRDSA